jgi:hypothetical protein
MPRYSDKPQLIYGTVPRRTDYVHSGPYVDRQRMTINYGEGPRSTQRRAFPADMRPLATAPEASQPVIIYEQNGTPHWALHHKGAWRNLAPFKNQDGTTSWRMDGTRISNAVGWNIPKRGG